MVLLAIVVASGLIGVWRGFVREAMSVAVWLAAIWLAWRYGPLFAPQLAGLVEDQMLRGWAARAMVFLAAILVGSVIAVVLAQLLRATGLGPADRAVGLAFGVVRGVVLAALAVLGMQLAGLEAEPWWHESKLVPYAAPVTDALRDAAQKGMERLQGGLPALEPPVLRPAPLS
jgi:membrane protein required for colicin V production